MRSREEILDEVTDNYETRDEGFTNNDNLILEVLLDIRELLTKENKAGTISITSQTNLNLNDIHN